MTPATGTGTQIGKRFIYVIGVNFRLANIFSTDYYNILKAIKRLIDTLKKGVC
jgi:hypothetical protein